MANDATEMMTRGRLQNAPCSTFIKKLRMISQYLLSVRQRSQVGNGDHLLYPQGAFPDRRPLVFPDLTRLSSLYMGWTFRKSQDSGGSTSSWKHAIPSQISFSTEELFLGVLSQIIQRAKLNRTLQDDCKKFLKSKSKRILIDNLLRENNKILRHRHPQLEWKLAGLESTVRKKNNEQHQCNFEDRMGPGISIQLSCG